MVYHKNYDNLIKSENIKICLIDLKILTIHSKYDPIFIFDNTKIHHSTDLSSMIESLNLSSNIFLFTYIS
ncbi:hypothetical protein A0H76_1563 [Hepatospora eriocheir]|uniref:Uncharacterized protein n=1 Tax=Hepatospora eriocheir TaxID=1081669 RepID=A0A1X0QGV5_9MICR|nr:hypothetical protein A0H76_1563 [Hepatospora eriocheir]